MFYNMALTIQHPEKLDKLLARLADPAAPRNESVPCIALVVRAKDGSILYSHSGNESLKPETPSWLASLTKIVTPIAILQLVERGLITLDEPVQRFLPECDLSNVLENFDEEGKPILRPATVLVTLRNLLNHTSGYGFAFVRVLINSPVCLIGLSTSSHRPSKCDCLESRTAKQRSEKL